MGTRNYKNSINRIVLKLIKTIDKGGKKKVKKESKKEKKIWFVG